MRKAISVMTLFLFLLAMAASAQALEIKQLKVLDYGVYRYDEKIVLVTSPPDGSEKAAKLSNISLIDTSAKLPIQENTFFSISYVLEGEPGGEPVDLDLKVSRPGGVTSSGLFTVRMGVVTTNTIEVAPDDLPGKYILEIQYKNRNLLKKEITVYTP